MAVINHTYKFVFVHVPKTAGTSVTHALNNLCSYRDLVLGGTAYGEKFQQLFYAEYGIAKHSTATELKGLMGDDWNKYYKFACVRNPYTRAVSLYSMFKKKQPWFHEAHVMDSISNFKEFVCSEFFQIGDSRQLIAPQSKWLIEDGSIAVNEVYRFEELERISSMINRLSGGDIMIPKLNVSEETSESMDDDTKELISVKYKEDFDRFGYSI